MKKYIMMTATFCALLVTNSCTKNFDKLNTDPTTLSSLPASAIPKAFARSEWEGVYADPGSYELIHSLFTDFWSQYFADGNGDASDRNVINQDWIISQWNLMYTVNWPSLKIVIDQTAKTSPAANAIAKVWKVFLFHQHTDLYGPVPYSKAGLGLLSIPYDSQQSIYADFFKTLDEAVAVLKTADKSQQPFGTDDLIYHGDIQKWLVFANSLRLRLALRVSYVDPVNAKIQAEQAIKDGVMMVNTDNAFVDVGPNSINGLADESPWENMRMSASMESYLKGYNDPRMQQYYEPSPDDGQFHGLRNGLTVNQIASAVKVNGTNLSNINTTRWSPATETVTPLKVMYASECYFLRAEGALNGWNMGGSAKDLYEQGITYSMQQWGITDATAISNYIKSSATPIAITDYLNSPAVATVPISFATDETMERQQIQTQKWIALFPDGMEAWAEVRRTGYPKLYPVVKSDNPDVSTSDIIRRFTFLNYEYQTNAQAVKAAIPLLNGPDKASTHVWWNK